jgi:predicted small metal-binding protein
MKTLSCKDLGTSGCNYEIQGESEEEILKKAAEHGMKAHKQQMTPELEKMLRSHIKSM